MTQNTQVRDSTFDINESMSSAPRRERYRWVFKRRGLLMLPPVLFCLFSTVGDIEWDSAVLPIGLTVFSLGVLLRFWCQLHLHYRLGIHKVLTISGPYEWVRNPIYIGNTLVLLGLCIFSEVVYFLPVMLLWAIVVYSFVVRYEEAHLLNKYGQPYREYCQRVPRWLPRIPSHRKVVAVRKFIPSSILAVTHNLLILLPFVLIELLLD